MEKEIPAYAGDRVEISVEHIDVGRVVDAYCLDST